MKKFVTLLVSGCFAASALASTEAKLDKAEPGADVATVERGMEAMMTDCNACHSMKYIKYRDLVALGIDKQKVDVLRGDLPLDAPLKAQMSEADAEQSFGKAPPDLSLMAKARDGGADYVYSYLLGYYAKEDGTTGNHYYPETKMPDVLGVSGADDAQRKELKDKARDIVSFLSWAADPHEQERIRLGKYVMAYLFVLTFLLYLVKKQVWARLK